MCVLQLTMRQGIRHSQTSHCAELYDAELERMNNAMSADNQALQNDNRQLNALIREYEQALEKVMNSFRTRAVCPVPPRAVR